MALLLRRTVASAPWHRKLGQALAGIIVLTSGGMLLARLLGLVPVSRIPAEEAGVVVIAYGQASLTLLLLGLALLTLDAPRRRALFPAEVLALATFLSSYATLLGYAYGDFSGAPTIPMALPVAFALIVLSIGILCARPDRGGMATFTRASPGGIILRRFLPVILLGPPALGLLRLEAVQRGWVSEPRAVAILVLFIMGITLALALWNAFTVDRLDAERRRSEEYLRQFQLLVSSVTDYAIFLLDPHGRVRTWNLSAERLKGFREAEILGKPFQHFFSRAEIREGLPQRLLKEAASTGRSHDEGWRMERDGAKHWEDLVITALREPAGRLVGFAVITRDITARKRADEAVAQRTAELKKAKELNALKDHFLSTISHEMKTPLSLITGYAELLEELGEQRTLVAGIQEGTRRLTEHIDHILDYSALLSGALPLYPTEVNLAEVAANARSIMVGEGGLRQREIVVEVDPGTPPIRGDARRITQMIVELLENAEKFTPPGGRMGVRIGHAGREVHLDVWDTGPGISEEDFPRIWEAFSQLAVGDALRKSGLGLGLTIVKKLAELHGGKVAVVSQPGRGATFSITLPVAGPPATGKSATGEPEAGESEAGASGPGEAGPPPPPGR
jgi:PAS domain S-box-containing protein